MFIDKAAAQTSLVCGSSSVTSGNDMVGLTWEMTANQRIIPCFDTVDSANDPVNGLRTGRQESPWLTSVPGILSKKLPQR